MKARLFHTAGGRRSVVGEMMPAALRSNRPNREDCNDAADIIEQLLAPIDMVLHCPACGDQHIDEPERSLGPGNTERLDWDNRPHRSHLCHGCGHVWRPADVATNGVRGIKTQGKDDSPVMRPLRSMGRGHG